MNVETIFLVYNYDYEYMNMNMIKTIFIKNKKVLVGVFYFRLSFPSC